MQTWFECAVKVLRVTENGVERNVREVYLVNAVSYTDAEARITKEMQGYNFKVSGIKESNIREVFAGDGEFAYKAKISIVTVDEEAGREKSISEYYLVFAESIDKALSGLYKHLDYLVIPYDVQSIALTTIIDALPYE